MKRFHKYIPVTELEEKWGFYVTTAGYSKTAANQPYPSDTDHPSTHSFSWNKGRILDGYYLVFISKGRGVFESAKSESVTVEEGSCFFLFPGIWHRYKPEPDWGWEEFWVGFKGAYPEQLMNDFFHPSKPCVEIGLNENLLSLFQKLLEAVKMGSNGYHQMITGITLQILALVHTESVNKQVHHDPDWALIEKAKFLMRESIEDARDMQKLAEELPMGYSKFRKVFKKHTGLSPNQYHLNLRINKACELLETTFLQVNEIALQTGFESTFHFSKMFRSKNGCSPSEYRDQKNILVNRD